MNIGIGGKLSSGKTISAVMLSIWRMQNTKKEKVISNIQLNLPNITNIYTTNDDFVMYIKRNYTFYDRLAEKFSNSILIVDEAVNLISSRRSSSNINELMLNFFMQLGKLDCDLIYTYQVQNSQVDVILREICDISLTAVKLDGDTKKPLIFDTRITDKPINILLYGYMNVLSMRKPLKIVYNPAEYFQYYDTREMTLMDRSKYVSGGKSDIRKI